MNLQGNASILHLRRKDSRGPRSNISSLEISQTFESSFVAEEAIAEELIQKSKMSLNPEKDIPDIPNLKGEKKPSQSLFPEIA